MAKTTVSTSAAPFSFAIRTASASDRPVSNTSSTISTRCGGAPYANVRAANVALVDEFRAAEMGPDLDLLAGAEFRHDGCHLNERGQQHASALWLEALARGPLPATTTR